MSWQNILKTAIAGTERGQLSENDLQALGLHPSGDPARDALEALAAGSMSRKAGFQWAAAVDSGRDSCRPDERLLCGPEVAKDLEAILAGRYAGALPEFLDLLIRRQRRLPPENLPELLDTAVKKPDLSEKILTAAGPLGEWLVPQNPHWHVLEPGETADWFTASFVERKRLLLETRTRTPLLALAWLEKTWAEEKVEHKIQFLEILHTRLSATDEDLLNRALLEKNRDLRLAAIHTLVLLPGSRRLEDVEAFFKKYLADALAPLTRQDVLKTTLPDLSEDALQPWIALLPTAAKADWRNELLRFFIGLLPPASLLRVTGLSREKIVQVLDHEHDAIPLLSALVRYSAEDWVEPLLGYFTGNFRHAVWRSKAMTAFLERFMPHVMRFLARKGLLISHENEFFLRALENFHQPWPETLLHDFLDQYNRAVFGGNGEMPGWHFAAALRVAAYYCRREDIGSSAFLRFYLQNPPTTRPRELEDFLAVLRFRQDMAAHLEI